MNMKKINLIVLFFFFTGLLSLPAGENSLKLKKISDRIFSLQNTEDGTSQLAVRTSRGVVVFNSFWSKDTALKFKNGWIRELGTDKFIYNINTADRIDIFGGNEIYNDIPIISHSSFTGKFTKTHVDEELKKLIKMWRWKEEVSRKRLPTHKKGSESEKTEKDWLFTCKRRADELESGFSLHLPTITYSEKMNLSLGDTTLELIWFGKAGYDGMTLVVIPEEKTVLIPGFILHPHHFAPHPQPWYTKLDVPRWIDILSGILEGEKAVDRVVINAEYIWARARALTHLNYIRTLWKRVEELESEGKTLEEVQDLCSIDRDFSFFKDIQTYKERGEQWSRPQHEVHVMGFYFQFKTPEYADKKLKELMEKGK